MQKRILGQVMGFMKSAWQVYREVSSKKGSTLKTLFSFPFKGILLKHGFDLLFKESAVTFKTDFFDFLSKGFFELPNFCSQESQCICHFTKGTPCYYFSGDNIVSFTVFGYRAVLSLGSVPPCKQYHTPLQPFCNRNTKKRGEFPHINI